MGIGFAGGEWRGGHFAYNTAIVHVNTTVIHNTYINTTVVNNTTIVNNNHVAYSGGAGGINHPPTAEERVAEHETHQAPSPVQQAHIQQARSNPQSFAKNNGGHPPTAAVARPLSPSHPLPAASAHAQGQADAQVKSHSNTNNNRTEATAPHPTPQSHPAPQAEPRPAPQSRPAPQERPAPQAHPAAAPRSEPRPQAAPKEERKK